MYCSPKSVRLYLAATVCISEIRLRSAFTALEWSTGDSERTTSILSGVVVIDSFIEVGCGASEDAESFKERFSSDILDTSCVDVTRSSNERPTPTELSAGIETILTSYGSQLVAT